LTSILKFLRAFRSMVRQRPEGVSNKRWLAALAVALASDVISFGDALFPALQIGVDLATALLLATLLGWNWALATALVAEAIPGLAAFPTWVMVVAALGALDKLGSPKPEQAPPAAGQGKVVLAWGELAAKVAELKSQGKKVVFTNGVFDLLHVGHLRYLAQARGLGDALVVAINSDSSVKALKGEARPILPEAERAELLAGLDCVSFVTVFSEPDPRAIISAVRPSVLAKGGDWPVGQILGSDTVLADGGEVRSLGFVPGRSTTTIVESILQRYPQGFKE
jgi:D-beta-D-heptose 7-phosphate kinase/D-beta-D-heptose 1-phosphate adenosyltransferase